MYHKRRNCLVTRRENWEGLSRRRISGAVYRSLCSEMRLSPPGPPYELFCDRAHAQARCSNPAHPSSPLHHSPSLSKMTAKKTQPTETTKRNSGQLQIKLLLPRGLNWMEQQMEIKNKQNNNKNKKP